MTSQLVGTLVDCAIPIFAGIYCTLLGYRVVGKKPGASDKYDVWYARYGKWLKVAGPVLIVITLVRLLSALAGVSPGSRASAAKPELAQKLANIQPGEEREIGAGLFLKMFRIQVNDPVAGGWQRAKSTEGGFTVEVPLPFNDFRMRTTATDGVEQRSHSIGGKTAGLLAFSVTCITRRDGKLGPDGRKPAAEQTQLLGTPPKAEQRTVEFDDMICVLIVEAQGTDALPPAEDRLRFLRSFKRTGKPTW